jgi:hypothetical protein
VIALQEILTASLPSAVKSLSIPERSRVRHSEAGTLDGRGVTAPFFELGISVVSKRKVFEITLLFPDSAFDFSDKGRPT